MTRSSRQGRCSSLNLQASYRPLREHGEAGMLARPLVTMPSKLAHAPMPEIRVRRAERGDIDALVKLEHRVFATDRLSRRSLQRFLRSPSAEVIVAEENAQLAGIVIVLF